MRFDTILVANRGEIALRIIKTIHQMGLRSVAVYSDIDADAPHVAAADTAVRIGPAESAKSYLDADAVLAAAKATGAGAIHPGYGFLSENAAFAEQCAQEGMTFIGPCPDAIRIMGDKAQSKQAMLSAGVPCIPGYQGAQQSPELLAEEADRIGYPVMIKATAGGGGKGMRLVRHPANFDADLELAQAEALGAFGSATVILERALIAPRHVEVQIFADAHGNTIHLGERDCSVQRRHQKVLEEAPSPAVSSDLRAEMGRAAVAAAKAVNYVGTGTVEFLLDQDGAFYFLEMNTRLQVEHPVTEMVTGIDLVKWQIAVAQNEPLPMSQDDIALSGWSIEARLYAEDPGNGFLPSTGQILRFDVPSGPGLRIDSGVTHLSDVSPHYDPMLAKMIASGDTRDQARLRLIQALESLVLFGPMTNQPFLIDALRHHDFVGGVAATDFIETRFPPDNLQKPLPMERIARAVALRFLAVAQDTTVRLSRPAYYLIEYANDRAVNVIVIRKTSGLEVIVDGESFELDKIEMKEGSFGINMNGCLYRGAVHFTPQNEIFTAEKGHPISLVDLTNNQTSTSQPANAGMITAPMHGRVAQCQVKAGDVVVKGQAVVVLEAMKMQHTLVAPQDGIVAELHAIPDDQVETGQVLAEIELVASPK